MAALQIVTTNQNTVIPRCYTAFSLAYLHEANTVTSILQRGEKEALKIIWPLAELGIETLSPMHQLLGHPTFTSASAGRTCSLTCKRKVKSLVTYPTGCICRRREGVPEVQLRK